MADSLFASGKFTEAAISYERGIFDRPDHPENYRILVQKSFCYKQTGQHQKAIRALERIPVWEVSDSLFIRLKYELALNYYLSREFSRAEAQIKQVRYRMEDGGMMETRLVLLEGLIYNELGNWDAAKKSFCQFIDAANLEKKHKAWYGEKLDSLYQPEIIPEMKLPGKAYRLSTFFPGTGQMYAGYPGEGIANMMFHLIAFAFAAEEIYFRNYLTGYFGGFALLQKFYFGGRERARFLAEKHNHETKREFIKAVEELVLKAGTEE